MVVLLLASASNIGRAEDSLQLDEDNYLAINMVSYRDALSFGRSQDKPIFLYFTASYGGNTTVTMNRNLADTKVIKFLNKNFVSATINVADLQSLASKYQVKSVPTVVFLDAGGKRMTSVNGAMSVDKILSVGQYIVEKGYLHTAYDTWADKQKKQARGEGGH